MQLASQTFAIEALSGGAAATGLIGAAFILMLGGILLYMLMGQRTIRFAVGPDGLEIKAPFYGRRLPRSALKLDGARVVEGELDLKTYRRTNGLGLPGYRVGWYRSGNGDKTLLFVSDPKKVVQVPTTEGYTILMSADRPEELLAALRQ